MQKAKLMLTGLTFLGIAALAGCSFPGVYKIDIQQGNVVTQDMIDQLRPGMTQRQVRFIMGNPLIADTFHPDRWDYLYSMQPGGGKRQQERVTLVFDAQQRLAGLSGDYRPGASRDEAILGKPADAVDDSVVPPAAPQQVVDAVAQPQAAPVVESAPVAEPQPAPESTAEQPPRPGSLLERIQRVLDSAEPAPVPTTEPLDSTEE